MRANPALYQINTRVTLHERGVALGRRATLDDVDDGMLDEIADRGFSWVWFLGVWQTGPAGRAVSRANVKMVEECRRVLPDLRDEDITGSPFAIAAYTVTTTSAAIRRWRASASGWRGAASSCCSTSCPTTPRPITPG